MKWRERERENGEEKRRTAVHPAPRWIHAGELRSVSILPALAMSTQYGTLARAITVDDGYLRTGAAAASVCAAGSPTDGSRDDGRAARSARQDDRQHVRWSV